MQEYSLTRYALKPALHEVPRCDAYTARYIVRLFLCEMIGVAGLSFPLTVFTGLENLKESKTTLMAISYGLWIWTFGPMSGPQLHPCVSLILIYTRRLSYPYAIVSIVAQVIGAIFGCGMAVVITQKYPDATHHYGLTKLPAGSTVWRAFLMEAIAVSTIVLMALSTLDESRQGVWACGHIVAFPFLFAMAVVLNGPMIAAHSGIGLNPAMMIGAAIVNNYYKDLWVHVAGPVIGFFLAASLHEMVLSNAASSARLRHWFKDYKFNRRVNYKVLDGEVPDNKIN